MIIIVNYKQRLRQLFSLKILLFNINTLPTSPDRTTECKGKYYQTIINTSQNEKKKSLFT